MRTLNYFARLTVCGVLICTVLFSFSLALIAKKKPSSDLWGAGTDPVDFRNSLLDVLRDSWTPGTPDIRPVGNHAQPIKVRKQKLSDVAGYVLTNPMWPSNYPMPGADLCAYKWNGKYGYDYRCVAEYNSDETAYAGWKEAGTLLIEALSDNHVMEHKGEKVRFGEGYKWRHNTRNTTKPGSLDLQMFNMRKSVGKNWRTHGLTEAPNLTFTTSDSPIVVQLYLYYRCVLLEVRNPESTDKHFGIDEGDVRVAAADAIDEISRGSYSPLPPARAIAGTTSGETVLEVRNGTAYQLTVYLSGPSDKTITLRPGQVQKVSLVGGQYRIGGKVEQPGVLPFYGAQSFSSGVISEDFYIATQ